MVEMVVTLDLGSSARKSVQVRPLLPVPRPWVFLTTTQGRFYL